MSRNLNTIWIKFIEKKMCIKKAAEIFPQLSLTAIKILVQFTQDHIRLCFYLLLSTLTRLADGFGSKEVDPTLFNIEIHPKRLVPPLQVNSAYSYIQFYIVNKFYHIYWSL